MDEASGGRDNEDQQAGDHGNRARRKEDLGQGCAGDSEPGTEGDAGGVQEQRSEFDPWRIEGKEGRGRQGTSGRKTDKIQAVAGGQTKV